MAVPQQFAAQPGLHDRARLAAQHENVGNLAVFSIVSLHSDFLNNLAAALHAGRWTRRAMLVRARRACADMDDSLPDVIDRVLRSYPALPPLDRLRRFLRDMRRHVPGFAEMPTLILRQYWKDEVMQPQSEVAARWPVPAITTSTQLAERLGLSVRRLEWWADAKGINRKATSSKLRHYHARWLPKRGGRYRLVEIPKLGLRRSSGSCSARSSIVSRSIPQPTDSAAADRS